MIKQCDNPRGVRSPSSLATESEQDTERAVPCSGHLETPLLIVRRTARGRYLFSSCPTAASTQDSIYSLEDSSLRAGQHSGKELAPRSWGCRFNFLDKV